MYTQQQLFTQESKASGAKRKVRSRCVGDLPVDVGMADATSEVFEAPAWRPSIVEGLYRRIRGGL